MTISHTSLLLFSVFIAWVLSFETQDFCDSSEKVYFLTLIKSTTVQMGPDRTPFRSIPHLCVCTWGFFTLSF